MAIRSTHRPRKRLLVHLSQAVETLAQKKTRGVLETALEGSLEGKVKLQFLEVNNREFTHFEKVSNALDRLDRGTYGRCIFCGQGIEADVLKQTPWATECRGCGDQESQP